MDLFNVMSFVRRVTLIFVFLAAVYVGIVFLIITHSYLNDKFNSRNPVVYKPQSGSLPFAITTNYWTQSSVNTSFFAAYFDDRQKPQLLLIGAHRGRQHSLFCQVFYDIGEKACLPITVKHYTGDKSVDHVDFHPYRYICLLQRKIAPVFVLVFADQECTVTWGNQTLIPVASERPKNRKRFGLCVGSPVFRRTNVEEIVHVIEGNRVLGSEWFTIYIQDTAVDTVRALKSVYEELGQGEVIDTWASEGEPSPWFYNGQILALNDCLYRNMFRVQYLVTTDLDELIVPERSLSWHQMMAEIDVSGEYGAFRFRHRTYVPSNEFQISTLVSANVSQCSDGRVLTVPRCLEYNKKATPILPSKRRCKHILKPTFVNSIGIHHVSEFHVGKLRFLLVPIEIGLLRHYRRRRAYKSDAPHIYDPSANGMAEELMRYVHGLLCDKMRGFYER